MTSITLSACSWSSARWTTEPQSERMYSTSAAGLVGYRPTVMARIATVAKSRMIHSGRSSEWMETRSPG